MPPRVLLGILLGILTFPANLRADPNPNGCSPLIENFCKELHSPEHQGNWDLKVGGQTLEIRLGLTQNDFLFPEYRGMQLMLQNEARLPDEVRAELREVKFFEKLRKFLNTKPYGVSNAQDRVNDIYLTTQIDTLWRDAIKAARFKKMERLHPGYAKTRRKDRPPGWLLEETRIYADLRMAANRAIWEFSPEWDHAKAQFEDVRHEIIGMILGLRETPTASREQYLERLRTVILQPPGTSEEHLDDECATSLVNAFYNLKSNSVQICAGLVASTNSLFTVAHELSHTLDPTSTAYYMRSHSRLGSMIQKLKDRQCESKVFACEDWKNFKKDFSKMVEEIPDVTPQPSDFYRCFQTRKLSRLSSSYISDHAKRWVNDDLEYMSNHSIFLKLIKPDAILPNGKSYPNPSYLNPCGLEEWSRVNDEYPVNPTTPLLLFFTAEYSCSESLAPDARLRNAIETAKNLQLGFNQRLIEMPGGFSSDSRLASDGYAEDVGERVADAIGSEVVARVISRTPELNGRRLLYFSVLADRCDTPSWKSRYTAEGDIENEYSWDPHSQGLKRLLEAMRASTREQLKCEKDFELKECTFR